MDVEEAKNGNLINFIINRCYELHERLYSNFGKYDGKSQGKIPLSFLG